MTISQYLKKSYTFIKIFPSESFNRNVKLAFKGKKQTILNQSIQEILPIMAIKDN